ncbi:MAG: M16 family metallopeptidase [Pyrinomonadaceae bacterium]
MKKIYKTMFFAFAVAAFGINIYAQNMNEDFRRAAPAPLAPRAFNIVKPFETKLSNGLKIIIFEDRRLPITSFRLAFRTGDIDDPQNQRGLTAAVTHLLREGTATRTSQQLAEDIEKLGATLTASSSSDNTIVAASSLSAYSSNVLKLMAEMTLTPSFPENEVALYKQNTIKNLQFQRSQPDFLAGEQTAKILFGAHPYAVVSPSPADVEKITREQLAAFHKEIFVPNNATLIVVGDVNRADLLKEVETLFGKWKNKKFAAREFPALPTRAERTLTIVDRPGSAQSNIVLANLGIERSNPDYFPVLLMNQVLGAGASSRLFMNLREAKGYTYGAYSSLDARRQAGAFEATAEVRTPVTGDSLKEFFYELERIRNEQVSAKELTDAKNFLTGVFPLRAETQEGLTNLIVAQQLYNLPDDYLQTYRDKVNAVTAADIERVANKYVTPEKMALIIVGDAGEILKQVKPYSTKIEVFDTEGKAVNINSYNASSAAPTVNVTGRWNLSLDVQGQKIPVTLDLEQDGDKVTGTLDSMLGKGEIPSGKVSGNKLISTAKTQIQGQDVELNLNGTIEGDTMKGIVNASIPGFPPVNFEGSRDKATAKP